MTSDPTTLPSSSPALDLLVLGGTSWLGGAVARTALERGHRVTCLARGEAGTPPDGVAWVRADRSTVTAYDEVADRDWDAVVDVSWQPDFVRSALTALGHRTGHWVYVSSCSVYSDDSTPDTGEDAAVHPPHEGSGPVSMEQYGPAKVACEQACLDTMGADHTAVARAGLIAGYGDRSDRLGYWPARIDRAADDGEPVLVPPRDTPLQVIDVEDLAQWLVHLAEHRTARRVQRPGRRHHDRCRARRLGRGRRTPPVVRRAVARVAGRAGGRAVDRAPSRWPSGCRSRSTPAS